VAGGQKEIDNAYGAPERKRHCHEHDNKDRNFPPGYTFHFFRPHRTDISTPPYFEIFRCQEIQRPARNSDKTQAQEKAPDNAGA